VLPWFRELLQRGASSEERDPSRAMDVPFGMRAGIVTALAGVADADDPSGTVRAAVHGMCTHSHTVCLPAKHAQLLAPQRDAGQG